MKITVTMHLFVACLTSTMKEAPSVFWMYAMEDASRLPPARVTHVRVSTRVLLLSPFSFSPLHIVLDWKLI